MWQRIIWNEEPGGNVEHIEEHRLTVDDVEHGLATYEDADVSRASGLPCVFGYTPDGPVHYRGLRDARRRHDLSRHRVRSPGTITAATEVRLRSRGSTHDSAEIPAHYTVGDG